MVSVKVKRGKKPLITVIIAFLVVCMLSFGATTVIYNSTFSRYDCNECGQKFSQSQKRTYYSGKNLITGYLVETGAAERKDALIVLAPGHNACSEDYISQIDELNALGWSVFVFDATGVCASEGKNCVGFLQETLDLEETLKYIEKQNRFGYNDIVLMGHSKGGYAACCALESDFDIAAIVSISAPNSSMDAVISSAERYVGPLAYLNYGPLWAYQSMLFGSSRVNLRADEVISKTDVPALIIHGENDENLPKDRFSLISHKGEIKGENTEFLSLPAGHTEILFDSDGTARDTLILEINDFLVKYL